MRRTSRESFLQRVRRAVDQGNRTGGAVPLESRGHIGYQGAGSDSASRFRDEFTAAGGVFHLAADRVAAVAQVLDLAKLHSARRVLVGRGPFFDTLGLPEQLRSCGIEAILVDTLTADATREPFFGADLGVSGVDYLIAETGTIALRARTGEPRSLSLLPPIHIAVAERSQLLPDLFDLFEAKPGEERPEMPSCLSLITGPSKTGDIELRLVTGVHGPGEVHVILVG